MLSNRSRWSPKDYIRPEPRPECEGAGSPAVNRWISSERAHCPGREERSPSPRGKLWPALDGAAAGAVGSEGFHRPG